MIEAFICIIAGYAIGSVPVPWLAARAAGVDLRAHGSRNTGASNVIESVSPALGVATGLAQIAQGLLPVLLARALDTDDWVWISSGTAAVIASDWSPWLRFRGGRGIGVTIGVLLGASWPALAAFVVVAVIGRILRAAPQGVALALLAAPVAAAVAGESAAVVAGCASLAAIAMLKRLTANEAPPADASRPDVWINRLIYDRDIRDRNAWLRRGVERT